MKRNQLNDMSVFVEVARLNGFRAAAKKLDMSAGSVSEAIQRFEDRLGVRLIDRTTRKIALTSVGQRLYKRSLLAIEDLESAVQEVKDYNSELGGTLTLSAPRSTGPLFLDKLLSRFLELYPDVSLKIIYDDQKIDLVTAEVDAVIRSQTLLEQDSHAIQIGPTLKTTLVGSQTYFGRKGTPNSPSELVHHDGVCFSFGDTGKLAPWLFEKSEPNQGQHKVEKASYTVMPKPKVIVNDVVSLLNYARAGAGLAYLYEEVAAPYINDGSLKALFSDQLAPLPQYTINYLSKRNMPMRLRAFIELAKETVG